MGAKQQPESEVLERGSIYFLYRPKVESPDEDRPVKGLDDVGRTYIVLSPDGKDRYRRLVIGRKKLPEIEDRNRYWGFVEAVGNRPEKVKDDLAEQHYQTKTRGERKLPAARVAGEGVYAIVSHGGHTHLAYTLELRVEKSACRTRCRANSTGGASSRLNLSYSTTRVRSSS